MDYSSHAANHENRSKQSLEHDAALKDQLEGQRQAKQR